MTGPYRYRKAEEIPAELERTPVPSDEPQAPLALRAQAHAMLAVAAATAVDPDRHRQEWRDVTGARSEGTER